MQHNNSEILRVLHTVYRNTLHPIIADTIIADTITTDITIPEIKTELYPHQKTLINGMHKYRQQMSQGIQLDDHELRSKIGIITDSSGSGKTLAILGYLATDTEAYPVSELTPFSTPYFYTQKHIYPHATANLIIVPAHLFTFWQDEIKKHTTITYVPIETRGKIKENMLDAILSSTFVLTTNKCYRYVQEYATRNQITWNNVCIDEPLFIQMKSSDPILPFQFLWLISHQWTPLLFRNSIKKSQLLFLEEQMHPDLEEMLLENITEEMHIYPCQYIKHYLEQHHSHRGYIVLRNANAHVREGIRQQPIQHSIIQCKSTTTLQALSSMYLARNASIPSANIPQLFQALSIESTTKEDYLLLYPEKQEMVERRITENECGICLEPCVYPTILNCCHHLYCGKCMLQNTIIQFKCPMCRESITIPKIRCLDTIHSTVLQSKRDACMSILHRKTPTIVFIAFDKIYHDMAYAMKEAGIVAEIATSYSLRKALKNLKEGTLDVLFVSKIELFRGLSLPFISCLLFYHDQPVFEQRQALINAVQQSQRTHLLQLVYLYSEVHL